MCSEKLKIAYLAPEIPALSATFVYNEMLTLQEKGISIVSISVHKPGFVVDEPEVGRLAEKTCYLYQQPFWKLIAAHFLQFIRKPLRYIKTVVLVITDCLQVGFFTQVGLGLIYRFCFCAYLSFFLMRCRCNHIHVHFAHIPTDLAMYASKLSGISYSFTSHANDLFERGWLLRQKVKRACFAVTISEFNRRFLQSQGVSTEKVHVIPCGVHSTEFSTRPFRKMGSTVCLGSVGRMVEKKGFDDLLSACRILKDQGFDFRLELVGDGPMLKQLMQQAVDLDLKDMVSFKGALPHTSIHSWLETLDLFILPCKKDSNGDMDGIPVVLMEAMLTGIPVISTKISGIPELIKDGETGGLADANDPYSLAEAVKRICKDELLQELIFRKAVDKVHSQFDIHKNVCQLLTLFKEKCHDKSK
jgi:glycosyltransferase involved in cell wall biosynthesis